MRRAKRIYKAVLDGLSLDTAAGCSAGTTTRLNGNLQFGAADHIGAAVGA
jgi:hypothetical protein